MAVADGFAELPSAAELLERIARHQREMLDWAEGRRSSEDRLTLRRFTREIPEDVRLAIHEANRLEVLRLAAMVQAEVAVLEFVMART